MQVYKRTIPTIKQKTLITETPQPLFLTGNRMQDLLHVVKPLYKVSSSELWLCAMTGYIDSDGCSTVLLHCAVV